MPSIHLEPGSFRDRTSRVFYAGDEVCRALNAEALECWRLLRSKSFYQSFSKRGLIVGTEEIALDVLSADERASWAGVLRHGSIPFISYPYEWCFSMLKDAALLQLELLTAALQEDFILKDATSYNVQWKGTQPVFIDVPSFIPWRPGNPWSGYRQFCELFLYPLMVQAYRDIPYHPWLRGALDGISVKDARRLLAWDFYKPGVFADVILHARFQKRYAESPHRLKDDFQEAGFKKDVILANLSRITNVVDGLTWKTSPSHWVDYQTLKNYSSDDEAAKKAFVSRILYEKRRRLIWDFGCNTGDFSLLASAQADHVLALDSDTRVIETLYQSLRAKQWANILPLVVNVANLSAGHGWLGRERKAFVDRGRPDLILCLALTHHVTIESHIPLKEWIAWLAGFGSDLIIEFVTPDDSMVQRLLRNKDTSPDDYSREAFEAVLGLHYTVQQRHVLGSGHRILYACRPRLKGAT